MVTKKPKRKFKVLSVDFDYFSNVDSKTIAFYYPDGVDLTTKISEFVWASRYCHFNGQYDRIMAIKNSSLLLHTLHQILWDQNDKRIKCVVANSHAYIYSAIESLVRPGQEIEIDHIDFHHDCCNESNSIDCGNWLSYVINDHPGSTATWFTRLEGYDGQKKPDDIRKYVTDIVMDDLDCLVGKQYDLIFLCRSDAWTPPHLDQDFQDLVDILSTMFYNVSCQVCVNQPRDMENVFSLAEQMDSQFRTLSETLEKTREEEATDNQC